MMKKIKTQELKVGMYVILPVPWFKHPFLKSKFLIESTEEIDKITEIGIEDVVIDVSKGKYVEDAAVQQPIPEPPKKKWEPEKLIPVELKDAIHDKTLPPEKKAKVVYKSSVEMMSRLLDDPKAENIREAKKAISEIVDLIISDNETVNNLLKITSYDAYTYTHSVNVGVFSVLLSREAFKNSDAHDLREMGAGYFLHDIGKIKLDPAIINKQGRLTDEEMNTMRTHPQSGYKILSETEQLTRECKVIVMQHHERDDGKGYPHRLKGEDIHVYGRICSIADVYDALTAERSYKERRTPFEALNIMKDDMSGFFNKDLFDKFVLLLGPK